MPVVDGSIKSLMQGVSQQVPRERLGGQVSVQVNMLSDVVNGMRRRPGARRVYSLLTMAGARNDTLFSTYVDVEDTANHVLVNTETGRLLVLSEDFSTVVRDQTVPYLVAPNAGALQTAALRGHLYIANTSKMPTATNGTAGNQNPALTGFFFVKTGVFDKQYDLTISTSAGAWTVTYQTPKGEAEGDADKAKPDYIATQLATAMNTAAGTQVVCTVRNSYVLVKTPVGTCNVTSNAGSTYIGWSNDSRVALANSDLPARLPVEANGAMCAVGTVERNFVWYSYNYSTSVWVEVGAYNSPVSLQNMPIRVSLDGAFTVESPAYEGRLAGSDTTNENPAFLTNGITGFGAFQGRLVILAGPEVNMSGSGNPLRWWRSTVTAVLPDDPIGIYSGAATSTDFRSCVQFNKDLLLFSRSCQAVIPSGNSAITPSTAQIVITSQYSTDVLAQPGVVGRSVLYSIPRTEAFAGVLELIPSNTTDSQYTSNDITAHIPRYLPGRIRGITASTTSNSSLFLCTGDNYSVFVQNYLWSGDEKVQSAWHQWTMPMIVLTAWFVRDRVYLGLRDGNDVHVVTVEPQAGDTVDGLVRPFSDVYSTVAIVNRQFILPQHLRNPYLNNISIRVQYGDKRMWVGIEGVDTNTWVVTTVRNVPNGTYFVGCQYTSVLSPTPPLMRDQNGTVIGTSKSMLVRYELTVQNTGAFDIEVLDTSREITSGEFSGLLYSSIDLLPDKALDTTLGKVLVPVRALAQNTATTFRCDVETDMCILDIEYVTQYRALRRRA